MNKRTVLAMAPGGFPGIEFRVTHSAARGKGSVVLLKGVNSQGGRQLAGMEDKG